MDQAGDSSDPRKVQSEGPPAEGPPADDLERIDSLEMGIGVDSADLRADSFSLHPFVPGLALRYLANLPEVPTSESAVPFSTVAVFADISGFTALTEKLASEGVRGAENVREVLNSCFGPLSDLVNQHGGEVEKFAGDATLALWPAPEGTRLEEAARRASQCCLEAISELDGRQIRQDFQLRLRFAVTAGKAWLVTTGGVEGRWETLVIGDAIGQIGPTIQLTSPGQVVLSRPAWKLLEPWASGEPLDGGCHRISRLEAPLEPRLPTPVGTDADLEQALTCFVPFSVQSRLEAGQRGWLAEFRRVTVLFASLGEVPFDDEGSLDGLQSAILTFQRAVYRFGGSVNQVMTDDKGTCLIAAWGLALRTYDDNAARALRAALTLRRELQVAEELRIGVATGQTYTGLRGNRRRMEYALIGDAINLAARLMQSAAPGSILCDRYSRLGAGDSLDFEPLEPVRVKGKEKPIQVFHPLGQLQTRARQRQEILGRTSEKETLERHLQALIASAKGATVVVEGEAGIGKSHLLDDFVDTVRDSKSDGSTVRLLRGNGDAIERNRAHYPWRQIFSRLLDLESVEEGEAVGQIVRNALVSEEIERAPLLNPVLPITFEETEVTSGMAVQGQAEARLDLMVSILQRATRQRPTVLVMEDAHWLDSASWSLLEAVHREVAGLLLVIATRPLRDRDLTVESRRLFGDPALTTLRLGPLEPDAVLDLVRLRLGAEALPETLTEVLLAKAEGHPFFTEELAFSLRDQGLIRVEDGRCELAEEADSFGALSFPNTAQGVVTGRIDSLDPHQQLTLKVASVLGRRFDSGVLEDVHPIADDRRHLHDHLTALSELELIYPIEPADEASYRFKHSITQEAAYDLLPYSQRRQLHRSVAEWHEDHRRDELSSVFGLLAHHWTQAEVPEKALFYWEQAGLQAERSFAYKEVARSFAKALELDSALGESPDLDKTFLALSPRRHLSARLARRARWRRTLGYAKANLGQLEEGARELEECLRLLGERVPETRFQWIKGMVYQVLRQARHRLRPGSVHQQTGEVADCRLEAARAFARLGSYYYVSGHRLPFMYAMLAALNVTEHVPPSPELAMSYADVCNVAGLIPLHRLAHAYVRLALDTAEHVDEIATSARVLSRTGIYLAVIGDWRVLPDIEHSLALAERLGDPYQWEESAFLLGMARFFLGRFAEAKRLATEVIVRANRSGALVHEIWGLGLEADCALHLGEFENAIDAADRLLELIGESENIYRDNLIRGYGVKALAFMRLGERVQAEAQGALAESQIEAASRSTHIALQGFVAVAEIRIADLEASLSRGERPGRKSLAGAVSACATLDRFVRMMPVARARALLLTSRLSRVQGKTVLADQEIERSLADARRKELPYDEAKALKVKALLLRDEQELASATRAPQSSEGADEADWSRLLQQAAELFSACGARWHHEQCRRVLES